MARGNNQKSMFPFVLTPQFFFVMIMFFLVGVFLAWWGYKEKFLKPITEPDKIIYERKRYIELRDVTLALAEKLPPDLQQRFDEITFLANRQALTSLRRKDIYAAKLSLIKEILTLYAIWGLRYTRNVLIGTVILLVLLYLYLSVKLRIEHEKMPKPKKRLPKSFVPEGVKLDGKWKKAADYIYSVLASRPTPASIYYHEPTNYGLLRHSLRVAQSIAKKVMNDGLDLTDEELQMAFLIGLAHDVGKRFVYYPVYKKTLLGKRIAGWKSRYIPIVSHTKATVAEAFNYAGIDRNTLKFFNAILDTSIPKDSLNKLQTHLRDAFISADAYVTYKELFIVPKEHKAVYLKEFRKALPLLNINGIAKAQFEGFYVPSLLKDTVVVIAWALADKVSQVIIKDFGELQARQLRVGARGSKNLHPIVPALYVVLKEKGILKTECNGVKADDMGLLNVSVRLEGYKKPFKLRSVFLINATKIDQKLLAEWLKGLRFYNIAELKVAGKANVDNTKLAYEEAKSEDQIFESYEEQEETETEYTEEEPIKSGDETLAELL